MSENTDRRVRMTKALLRDTLAELMAQKPISKISVKELCQKAGVNRGTFYAHYTDQYELLRQVELEVIENLKNFLAHYTDDRMPIKEGNLRGILEYARQNADLFTVLLGEQSFQNDLFKLVKLVPFQYETEGWEKTYILDFAISGCLSVLRKWLQEGAPESPGEMAALVLKIIYGGLLSF